MSRVCVFPGTFDPVTNGHIDIIRRVSKLYDTVYVALLINREKKTMFSKEIRLSMLNAAMSSFKNVIVDSYDGLLVDFASKVGATSIVRGVRNISDFEYEYNLYRINSHLNNDIDTVFMPASGELECLSSSTVRELISYSKDVSAFVPKEIVGLLKELNND